MSPLTKKDVETVINRAVGSEAKVLSYKLEPFTKVKNGVLGSHTLLSVDIESRYSITSDLKVTTHTFFVKTPPESSVIQDVIMDKETLEEEFNFYREIQPLMLADYNGEKWSAKCYLVKQDMLIYEDLRAQGFSTPSELLMGIDCLKSALATLARFHASSLLAEAKLGKSLKKAYPEYFSEKMYNTDYKLGRGTKLGYETIVLMAEKFGLDASLVLPDLLDYAYDRIKPKEGEINVVCHSDLWKNNIMFNGNGDCVIVDYQILRYASPAVDVAMLIYLNTTPQFRKYSEIEIFQHYYSAFEKTLQQSPRKVKIPSYDYMLKEYLDHRLIGMTYAAQYLPGIYLNPDVFETLLNDPKTLEKWFLRNRIDFISPEIDSNPIYSKKIKDILEELLKETRRTLRP